MATVGELYNRRKMSETFAWYYILSSNILALKSLGGDISIWGRGGGDLPHSSKKCTITLALQSLYGLFRKRDSLLLKCLETSVKVCKAKLEAEAGRKSFEDAATGRDDFTANAVARDKAYTFLNE